MLLVRFMEQLREVGVHGISKNHIKICSCKSKMTLSLDPLCWSPCEAKSIFSTNGMNLLSSVDLKLTQCKVGSKPHPAPSKFLSMIGPTCSNSRWIARCRFFFSILLTWNIILLGGGSESLLIILACCTLIMNRSSWFMIFDPLSTIIWSGWKKECQVFTRFKKRWTSFLD